MKVYGDGIYAHVFGKSEQLEYKPKDQQPKKEKEQPRKPAPLPKFKTEEELYEDKQRYMKKRKEQKRIKRFDQIAEELRKDPNSKYHGTPTAAKIPKEKRCYCSKCEQARKLETERLRVWRHHNDNKSYSFYINEKKDPDIIELLSKQKSVSVYIRNLLRKEATKG